jgi:uncharacterized membrane protein
MSVSPFGWRHWLSARMFFPAVLASVIALAFFAGWHVMYGVWDGPRLHLNLFLAWVPYICALWAVSAEERHPHTMRPLVPGLLWLLFFPNAPYLITDWLYLDTELLQEHLWYGIGMFTVFSLCGLLLATVSLYLIHTLVHIRFGKEIGWLVVTVAIVLSGLGVYLGRFLRLNSWDVFTRPATVLEDLSSGLRNPENGAGPLGFTGVFAVLLFVSYYVLLSVRRAPRSREEQRLA